MKKGALRTVKFVVRFIVPGAVKEGRARIFLVVGAHPTTCTVLLSASAAMVAKKMGAAETTWGDRQRHTHPHRGVFIQRGRHIVRGRVPPLASM